MNIINVGTYPPKQCGIATFSTDLRNNLLLHDNAVSIMALSDECFEYHYSNEVVFDVKQSHKQDYIKAAAFINASSIIDLVILQHEYGIYGGRDGEYVLELAKLIHKPYVLITHTVLPRPSKRQKQILYELCHRATGIVCMTEGSRNLLVNLYEAPPELLRVIAHGVPDFKKNSQLELKNSYGLEGRQVITTFGLIGPGKGLELGIRAIAELVPKHPDISYLILGQTHPMLQRSEGEKYRQMLISLVDELDLNNNVSFVNKYLTTQELGEYLYMTDIYLSPYPNMDQAVSGTLAFAIGCGRAIVSTAYAYANEVLREGRGLLASEAEPIDIAILLEQILSSKELSQNLQDKAYELGKTWTWPNIAGEYTRFFAQILNEQRLQEEMRFVYAKL